jgi:hypothetical protein
MIVKEYMYFPEEEKMAIQFPAVLLFLKHRKPLVILSVLSLISLTLGWSFCKTSPSRKALPEVPPPLPAAAKSESLLTLKYPRRDPFRKFIQPQKKVPGELSKAARQSVPTNATAPSAQHTLRLVGIFETQAGRRALLHDGTASRLVQAGDTVSGEIIREVTPDGIKLDSGKILLGGNFH